MVVMVVKRVGGGGRRSDGGGGVMEVVVVVVVAHSQTLVSFVSHSFNIYATSRFFFLQVYKRQ